MKILYIMLVTLLPLGIYNHFHIIAAVSIRDLSIPYDGVTLKWVYDYKVFMGTPETVVDQTSETWLATYKKKSETTFEVKVIFPDETWTQEVDAVTRRIISISDSREGNFTSHWISTDVLVGDRIGLWDKTATVISTNEEVYLPSIRGGIIVRSFRLESMMTIDDEEQIITDFFDMNTGIRVNTVSDYVKLFAGYAGRVHIEILLTETNIDNDKDGLTDYDELFATLTNPIKSDSDGDLWKDSVDIMPNNFLLPNGLIIALVVIVSISGIIAYKFLKRRKALTQTESQPNCLKTSK